jgi:uncharacterized protein YkwD
MTTATPERGAAPRRHRRPLTAFAATMALAITIATPGLVFAWSSESFSSTDETQLVQLTNNARAAAGLKALKVDSALTSMARWRSKDMSDRDYFCHRIPPKGATIPSSCTSFPTTWPKVFDYLKSSGYCYVVAGENIGTNNFPDDIATQTIQQGFMDSPSHRANILGTGWDVIGIGAFKRSDGQHFWTVLFADKCGSTVTATPKPAATPKPTVKPTATPRPTVRPTTTPKATPKPIVGATPRPTVFNPTPGTSSDATFEPSSSPDPTDLADPTGAATLEPTLAPPDPTATANPAGNGESGDLGLQVVDNPVSNDLVDTIVGDVAGAYFGN